MVKKAWGFNLGSIFKDKPITHPALLRMRKRPINYSAGENVWRGQLDAWKDDEKNNREQYARQDEAWRKKVLSDYANATGNSVATAGAMFDSFRGKMNPSQAADFKSMKMQGQMSAEGAAYDEILKRLNAKGGDPSINMQNARRLAPVVAKNYSRQADGSWKAVSQAGEAQAKQVAKRLTPSTYPRV
jgi:hypothetical protein